MLDEPQDPPNGDVVVPVGGAEAAAPLLPEGEVGGVKTVVVFSIAQPVASVDASSRPNAERVFMMDPSRICIGTHPNRCVQVKLC